MKKKGIIFILAFVLCIGCSAPVSEPALEPAPAPEPEPAIESLPALPTVPAHIDSAVSASGMHSMYIKSNGSLWASGIGELCDGSVDYG